MGKMESTTALHYRPLPYTYSTKYGIGTHGLPFVQYKAALTTVNSELVDSFKTKLSSWKSAIV